MMLGLRLTQPDRNTPAYDQETYHLTGTGLGLGMVKFESGATELIKDELISVSLRHTS